MELLIFKTLILLTMAMAIVAQNCGCGKQCCSKFGYCGMTDDYCGDGCREGPCKSYSGVSVADVVTDAFFNRIISQAPSWCQGKKFYTRSSFISALKPYSQFGKRTTVISSKREIAAFFAHITHETGHMCYIEEINGASRNYCDRTNTQYPCAAGKKYHGRGPLQLSWNYNYGAAGRAIGFDGLKSPETVGNDNVVSFKTALWFWMNNVRSVADQGFGATIRAINSMECNGGNTAAVNARVKYYTEYCAKFGIAPESNLKC